MSLIEDLELAVGSLDGVRIILRPLEEGGSVAVLHQGMVHQDTQRVDPEYGVFGSRERHGPGT